MFSFRGPVINRVKHFSRRNFCIKTGNNKFDNYHIRKLKATDQEDVFKLVAEYWPDEPLNKSLRYLADRVLPAEFKNSLLATLNHELSFGAFDSKGTLFGMKINNLIRKNETVYAETETKDPAERQLNAILVEFEKRAKFWQHVQGDCAITMMGLVSVEWRNQGIIAKLLVESIKDLKAHGYGLRADCSSNYSQKPLIRYNARKIYALKYANLPFVTNYPAYPHDEIVMYYLDTKRII